MPTDEHIAEALKAGQELAGEVIAFRAEAIAVREIAVLEKAQYANFAPPPPNADQVLAVGTPSPAVLLAEGDSWFDYPWTDVLRVLEDNHGYDVQSVAHKGDRVEQMAYGGGQLEEFTRELEKLLRRGVIPKAILLSGGGNDIAGDEFRMLLNHAASPVAGLNAKILDGVVGERLFYAYVTILQGIKATCVERIGRPITTVLHGYDYPVADGRGFAGGWWALPGPWLEPGFIDKGYSLTADRVDLLRQLIDRFNEMLIDVTRIPEFSHVVYVDLRNTLPSGANYKEWWANELHPTKKGFIEVGKKLASAL